MHVLEAAHSGPNCLYSSLVANYGDTHSEPIQVLTQFNHLRQGKQSFIKSTENWMKAALEC